MEGSGFPGPSKPTFNNKGESAAMLPEVTVASALSYKDPLLT
jgi:hypothetical protein